MDQKEQQRVMVLNQREGRKLSGKEAASLLGLSVGQVRRLLLAMLDAVYFDTKKLKSFVAIKPKPAFLPLLEMLTLRPDSGICLVIQSELGIEQADAATPCFWWRRGRVELPVQKAPR